jgi:hypothetical protein
MRWRSPDLQEVIDFLSHPSDMIKANAAGYITHLSYMDDSIKQKVRGLDGIPLLVDLLNSEFPEVHKNACGALKNLSYGRNNDENKVWERPFYNLIHIYHYIAHIYNVNL